MNNATPPNKLHPLMATAAGAVILASGVGIATMTGLFNHDEKPTPAPVAVTTVAPATIAEVPPVAPTPPVVAVTPEPAKVVVKKEVVTHKVQHKAPVHKTVAKNEASYTAPKPVVCMDCGTVVAIQQIMSAAKPSGIGAVSGAIIGGVIGHQFGGGDGKKAMTAAGVVGGAMAGNQIEKSRQTVAGYEVSVQMDNGSSRTFNYNSVPKFSNGEKVRISNGTLMSGY